MQQWKPCACARFTGLEISPSPLLYALLCMVRYEARLFQTGLSEAHRRTRALPPPRGSCAPKEPFVPLRQLAARDTALVLVPTLSSCHLFLMTGTKQRTGAVSQTMYAEGGEPGAQKAGHKGPRHLPPRPPHIHLLSTSLCFPELYAERPLFQVGPGRRPSLSLLHCFSPQTTAAPVQ